jgi:ribosomal protein L35AE/L33A
MMIQVTENDIGRKVIYQHDNNGPIEHGTISSLSKHKGNVFVKFNGPQGELTACAHLEWDDDEPATAS